MHRNDYMFTLHNIETVRDMVNAATTAYCDVNTDSCLTIDLSFERIIGNGTIYDAFAKANINLVKPYEYRPPKKINYDWNEEDQILFEQEAAKKPQDASNIKTGSKDDARSARTELKVSKRGTIEEKKPLEKQKAVLWQIPSGEFYAVRFAEPIRALGYRKMPLTEMATAQEIPAIREKGSSHDDTDRDCSSMGDQEKAESPRFGKMLNNALKKAKSNGKAAKAVAKKEEKKNVEKKYTPNIRRRPDVGEITITGTRGDRVEFIAATKHISSMQ